jgi:hypothetical protein
MKEKSFCIYITNLISTFIIFQIYAPAQSISNLEYFPHHLNDYWLYDHTPQFHLFYSQEKIVKDSTGIDGMTYISLKVSINTAENWYTIYYIIDTLKQVWECFDPVGSYQLKFKLNAVLNEQWVVQQYAWGYTKGKVISIDSLNIFEYQTPVKYIEYRDYYYGPGYDTSGYLVTRIALSKDFGKIGADDSGSNLNYVSGVVLNGTLYGDTTLYIVNSIVLGNDVINEEFNLFQNYPNPFNPTTTIPYEIPEDEFVSLKVYDLLGREVTTLVNEEKPAGSYDVQFSANSLTSGIYFYQLKSGNLVETKKMILIK